MPQEANPFTPPETADAARAMIPGLEGYAFGRLKTLYYRSCNVQCIGALLVLACLYWTAMMLGAGVGVAHGDGPQRSQLIGGGMLMLCLVAMIGVYARSTWGRFVGVVGCLALMPFLPLGTAVGIVGLVAFIRAGELFGPRRIHHAQIRAAFADAKRQRKAKRLDERQAAKAERAADG